MNQEEISKQRLEDSRSGPPEEKLKYAKLSVKQGSLGEIISLLSLPPGIFWEKNSSKLLSSLNG